MLLLALALAAQIAPQVSAGGSAALVKPRILVLETRADAAYLDKVKAFGDLLATLLEERANAEIVPSSSVRDRLAVAADKLQAGCDDTSCMSEIAGALDARWVVASRASQVGGRWLMRVELFDGQDLKVVAQSTAQSDSVEGLASQAELLADGLLAKAPMIPRRGAATDTATLQEAPAAAPSGGVSLPLVVGGVSAVAALGTAAVGTWSFFNASGLERKASDARNDYIDDPNPQTRSAYADAGREADDISTVHNCVLLPLGCLCIPLGGAAIGGVWWGLADDTASEP